MDVRVWNGGSLVIGDHLFLGQHVRAFTAPAPRPCSSLECSDDGSGRRFFVIVEIVFGEFDQIETLFFLVCPVGLGILVGGLL